MDFRYLKRGGRVLLDDNNNNKKINYYNWEIPTKIVKIKENKTMKYKYIIGSIDKSTNEVSFSKHPHVHDSLILASDEAERLAEFDNKKKFIVVKVVGICTVPTPGVSWE